ncbi:hypothetical protein K525DRAFT_275349 [Schizophyllum commune Loenen D]|nr:hypothetical protein K525DRAFT_275349 [Schizophyllum commune Loenen D]
MVGDAGSTTFDRGNHAHPHARTPDARDSTSARRGRSAELGSRRIRSERDEYAYPSSGTSTHRWTSPTTLSSYAPVHPARTIPSRSSSEQPPSLPPRRSQRRIAAYLRQSLPSPHPHPSYLRPSPPTTTPSPTPHSHPTSLISPHTMPPVKTASVKTASVKAGSAEPREEEGEGEWLAPCHS